MEAKTQSFQNRINNDSPLFVYFYTPLCGTCQVAGKMVVVLKEILPEIKIAEINLNYAAKLADYYAIESVPCLAMFHNGKLVNKIYAFQSVPYLVEEVRTFVASNPK